METIKKYFAGWDAARIIKAIVGISLLAGFFATHESLYAMGAFFFGFQAVLNIGCPGGACAANTSANKEKQVMEFKKYEPNNDDKNNV